MIKRKTQEPDHLYPLVSILTMIIGCFISLICYTIGLIFQIH